MKKIEGLFVYYCLSLQEATQDLEKKILQIREDAAGFFGLVYQMIISVIREQNQTEVLK